MTESPPTSVDHIRYDILTQQALRGVMRTVLTDIAKNGLPGEHHFYISFNTGAPGVRISPHLRAQYPQDMTVILQHQFWDLAVSDEAFEVGMSFGGIPERLRIPFDAIKGFFDPSVQFALQFETISEADEPADADAGTKSEGDVKARKPAKRRPAQASSEITTLPAAPAKHEPAANAQGPGDGPDKPAGGGEVVRFDRFRKK
jgi:hypothetical protein